MRPRRSRSSLALAAARGARRRRAGARRRPTPGRSTGCSTPGASARRTPRSTALRKTAPNAPEVTLPRRLQQVHARRLRRRGPRADGRRAGGERAAPTSRSARPIWPRKPRDAIKDHKEERSAHIVIRYPAEDAVLSPLRARHAGGRLPGAARRSRLRRRDPDPRRLLSQPVRSGRRLVAVRRPRSRAPAPSRSASGRA